jgi:hypothetical protein
VILLLGLYPKEHKSGYNRDNCTPMFFAAQFPVSKLWKQPRCPTTDERIKKMWYRVNSIMRYCKNFYKCQCTHSTAIIKNK